MLGRERQFGLGKGRFGMVWWGGFGVVGLGRAGFGVARRMR
jgi:hypothetical protein